MLVCIVYEWQYSWDMIKGSFIFKMVGYQSGISWLSEHRISQILEKMFSTSGASGKLISPWTTVYLSSKTWEETKPLQN